MSDCEEDYNSEFKSGLTSVLLGFPAKEANKSDLSVLGNHIGGSAVWFQESSSPAKLLNCDVCGKQTDLLVQLSCPLPSKDYDRSIYVFACSDPNCRRKEGSVIALRGVESNSSVRERIKQETETQPENSIAPEGTLGDSIFSTDSTATNPFATNNPFTLMNTSAVETPVKSKKKSKSKKDTQSVEGRYPCRLIDVEEEYLEEPDVKNLLNGVKIEENDPVTQSTGSCDELKEDDIKMMETNGTDPAFVHFVQIVENNPDQVLRYDYGLNPLLYNSTDGIAEKLKSIEQTHTLEIQLMPHLISQLETPEMIAEGMEWGSIFVATDKEDKLPELNRGGVGYIREWVAVQWE